MVPAQPSALDAVQLERIRLPISIPPAALALVLVVALATTLRLVDLAHTPPNVTADEADNLQVIYHILAGTGPGLFGLDWKPAPAFSAHLIAGFIRVFGETIVGMRMASVVLSLLSLVVFYAVVRRSLSRSVSTMATLLLGTGLWYLHFSRSGWENGHIALYALLATLTLTLAVERRRWYWFAAAGVFAALGLYGYMSGRLIVVAVLIYLPVALFVYPEKRRLLVGFGVTLLVCVILFLPQLNTALDDWDLFNRRTQAVSILSTTEDYRGDSGLASILVSQVGRTLGGFILFDAEVSRTGMNARYLPPDWGVLDKVTGALFWLGAVVSLRRLRETALWWIMLLALLFPVQVLSTGTPDAARAVGAVPFYYLFVGLGLQFLIDLPIKRRVPVYAGALLIVAIIAYINVSTYFRWMDQALTAAARQPAVEVDEFVTWQSLQKAEAEAGRYGFNVGEWHQMRDGL